jgi:hypothetical protein
MTQYRFTFNSDHTDASGLAESLRRIAALVERGRSSGRNREGTARWHVENRSDASRRRMSSYWRIKADPDRYEEYLARTRERRARRARTMSPEELAARRQYNRERSREWLKRMREEDPTRWEQYLEKQRVAHRELRARRKAEKDGQATQT